MFAWGWFLFLRFIFFESWSYRREGEAEIFRPLVHFPQVATPVGGFIPPEHRAPSSSACHGLLSEEALEEGQLGTKPASVSGRSAAGSGLARQATVLVTAWW